MMIDMASTLFCPIKHMIITIFKMVLLEENVLPVFKYTLFNLVCVCKNMLLHRNINQTLINVLHRLLNCEIGGLNCCVITA